MNRRMVWIDGDDLTGWCCSACQWNITAPRFDSTVAALAFNRVAQEGFEKHICIAEEPQTHAVAGAIPTVTGAETSGSLAKVSRTALGTTGAGLTRYGLAIVLLGIGCLRFAARESAGIPAGLLNQQAVGPRIELHLDDSGDLKRSPSEPPSSRAVVDHLLYRGGSRPGDIPNYDPDRPARMLAMPSTEDNETATPRPHSDLDGREPPQRQFREAVLP